MKPNTLLTAPGWLDVCPPMPGRDGPTYAQQIERVRQWMAPGMCKFYESLRWQECPHMIFALYMQATELDLAISGEPVKKGAGK